MTDAFGDAREEELRFLLEVERTEGKQVGGFQNKNPRRDMVASLLLEGYLNGPGELTWTRLHDRGGVLGALRETLENELNEIAGGHSVAVRLSHKGRVRISELRQSLRSDRTRDRSGLLDGAHSGRGLRLAILDAGPGQPLAVAYLDANGLKQVNDAFDHEAGNVYLGAYAEAVLTAVGVAGEAYRLHSGGDEVLVLLPGHDVDRAIAIVRAANAGLAAQKLRYGEAVLPTGSLCAGIVVVRDPHEGADDVRKRADVAMKRAKDSSGETRPRTPRVALEGQTQLVDL